MGVSSSICGWRPMLMLTLRDDGKKDRIGKVERIIPEVPVLNLGCDSHSNDLAIW